jgi:hypothetical protein
VARGWKAKPGVSVRGERGGAKQRGERYVDYFVGLGPLRGGGGG